MATLAGKAITQRRTRTLRVSIALSGLVLAACGAAEFDPDSLGAQALTDLSEIEVEVLQDKFVSDEEAVAAEDVLRDCLVDAGFDDVFVSFGEDGASSGWGYSSSNEAEEAKFEALSDACQDQVNAISAVLFMQNDNSLFESPLPGLEAALEELDI